MTTATLTRRGRPRHRTVRTGVTIAALRILQHRELTSADLLQRLGQRFPDEPIAVDAVLAALIERKLAEQDGMFYGLTEAGHAHASTLQADKDLRAQAVEILAKQAAAGADHEGPIRALQEAEQNQRDALVPIAIDPQLLTRSPARCAASAADLRACALRPGAALANELPSRSGNQLRYRDGRVTDLAGNPLTHLEKS